MSLRSDRLLAAVALRQAWLDERLQVIERKLKITAPEAPVPAEPVEEHLPGALRSLRAALNPAQQPVHRAHAAQAHYPAVG